MIHKYTVKELEAVAQQKAKEVAKEYGGGGGKIEVLEWVVCTEDDGYSTLEIKARRYCGEKNKHKVIVYLTAYI